MYLNMNLQLNNHELFEVGVKHPGPGAIGMTLRHPWKPGLVAEGAPESTPRPSPSILRHRRRHRHCAPAFVSLGFQFKLPCEANSTTMVTPVVGRPFSQVVFSEAKRNWPFMFGFAVTFTLVAKLSASLDRECFPVWSLFLPRVAVIFRPRDALCVCDLLWSSSNL